ncbi:unnamed protein product [Prunus brigantina]
METASVVVFQIIYDIIFLVFRMGILVVTTLIVHFHPNYGNAKSFLNYVYVETNSTKAYPKVLGT